MAALWLAHHGRANLVGRYGAAGVAAVLLLGGAVVAVWSLRRASRFKRRYDAWGTRLLTGRRARPLD